MEKLSFNRNSLSNGSKTVRHKIQPGANSFRILPPFGNPDTHNGYPFRKWSVAWMIDPQSGKRRPFASPMLDREKCPVDEYSRALFKFIESKKTKLQEEGLDQQEIKKRLEGLSKVQWDLKLSHSYAYNALNKEGTVGILEVKKTAHDGIKERLNEFITDYGQDPIGLQADAKGNAGVWINIKKSGEGKETKYVVEFAKIKKNIDGDIGFVLDRTPVDESVAENYDKLGYDLSTLYHKKSVSEMRDILLYNLSLIAEEVPEAILPGYEEALGDAKPAAKVEQKPKAVKPAKVAYSLEEDDEDNPPFDVEDVAKVTKSAKPKRVADDDDLMALADSLLD